MPYFKSRVSPLYRCIVTDYSTSQFLSAPSNLIHCYSDISFVIVDHSQHRSTKGLVLEFIWHRAVAGFFTHISVNSGLRMADHLKVSSQVRFCGRKLTIDELEDH